MFSGMIKTFINDDINILENLAKDIEIANVPVNEHLFIIMDNRISIPERPLGANSRSSAILNREGYEHKPK